MNKFLRIIIGLSVITLTLLVTAVSCNKVGDDKNNANNNANNSSGNGDNSGGGATVDGCKTGTTGTNICFENFDTDVAEMVNGTIQLKASGFPTAVSANITGTDISVVKTAAADRFKRAFDVTIKVDGTASKEGLVLVGPGNLLDTANNVTNFSILEGVAQGLSAAAYAPYLKEGIVSDAATTTAGTFLPAGWNIVGSFMNDTAPTDAATAAADASPFAFTATTGTFATKPILFCKTTITTITDSAAAGVGTVQADTKLTGGQTASCYVGVLGANFSGKAADDWLKTAASDTFKKKFNIAVAGVKTDDKTIGGTDGMGLPGADDTAKIAAFKDGIDTTEMTELAKTNSSAYKKVSVEVVAGTFTYTPATIVFENFDNDVAEMVGNTIQLKASGFHGDRYLEFNTDMETFNTKNNPYKLSVKRAFDITISSEGAKAKEGLIIVGPGNLANVNAFSLDPLNKAITAYTAAEHREGIVSVTRANTTADSFMVPGWNIFGGFMNTNAPTSAAQAAADASPFAFTATTGAFAVQPFLLCQTTVTSIYSSADAGAGTAQDTTKLEGGQKASCYAGSSGNVFSSGKPANDWFDATTPHFKRKFNIAVAGIQTDGKTIANLGLTGNSAALRDGITTAEMKQITDANSNAAYTNIAVEVVKGTLPAYTAPTAARIIIGNFNDARIDPTTAGNDIEVIQIKAGAFPTTAASTTITSGIGALATAADASLERVFDITVAGGGIGGNARGGLVMVGPGNFTKVDDFSDNGGGGIGSLPTTFKEGYGSGARVDNAIGAGKYQGAGINFYGVFMNDTAPNSADDVKKTNTPFAFTAHGGSHPFLLCRTTMSDFSDRYQNTDTFAGGQTASCYVGSKGTAFSGQSATWLTKTASNTFKKTFNIAIGAIRTDGDGYAVIPPGNTSGKRGFNFINGLDSAEIADIASRYPTAFKKMSVTIVANNAW